MNFPNLKSCETPQVSVAIAAFNAVPFVSRAIASALNQLGVSIEILVVDDASTDGTAEFVRAEFAGDERVKVFCLPCNSGPAAARNVALAHARAPWIAVLDADDAIEPDHLRELVALAEAENADIAAGNFRYYDVHRGECVDTGLAGGAAVELLDLHSFVRGARPYTNEADFGLLKPVFRTVFLRSHGLEYPVDVRHGEDMELVLDALLMGARFVVRRDLCTYLYTTRESGQSRTPVNYDNMARHTLSLCRRPDIRSDSQLCRLLRESADAVRRLDLDRNWMNKTMSRSQLVRRAIRSAAGRRWLIERSVKKLTK